jgi:hypothetical protein
MSLDPVIEAALTDARLIEFTMHGPHTIPQMRDVVRASAYDIENVERYALVNRRILVSDGFQMYRVSVLDAAGSFFDACINRPRDVSRRLDRLRAAP